MYLPLILLFFIELFTLFFFSRVLTRELSFLLFRILKQKKRSVQLLAFFFLPGTTIHELAHYTMAKLLFVYAGKIHLLPEIEGNYVKLGTVEIGKTDPIRRFFIGVAPFIVGVSLMIGIIYFGMHHSVTTNKWLLLLGINYSIFEIGNTMYSSKRDMKGAIEVTIAILIITLTLYIAGIRISFTPSFLTFITNFFRQATIFLLLPLLLDGVIISILKVINKN